MILIFIVLFPLIGYLVLSLGGRKIAGSWGAVLATFLVGLSFALSLAVFFLSPRHGNFSAGPFTWISASGFTAAFGFQADALTRVMLLMVSGVSMIIHLYSIGYMHGDEYFNRFFAYLNLFVFFMLLLVAADNYLLLFAGWEGVGLTSYLLIGFWFRNPEYAKAANKAFIMNRIGDVGFLFGMALLFWTFGSLSFTTIHAHLPLNGPDPVISLIVLFLLIGAVGKSAQIPLFTWLPDAMAGPTPVSALIHAATMVTAGVYLIIRSAPLFILSPVMMHTVAALGMITALFAALIALRQNDIKKILAYSTVSQLGFMFFALGLGAFDAALFHLLTHAFFKALLFLAAGSVIHACKGEQDIRKMGGLKGRLPVTYYTMLAGGLAISGIPPFSGFFSKDAILTAALQHSILLWILMVGVSLLSALYIFRLIFLVFHGEFRGESIATERIHESPAVMKVPLLILAFLSLTGGIINIPAILGGRAWLTGYLGMMENTGGSFSAISRLLMVLTLIAIAAMIYYASVQYAKKQVFTIPGQKQSWLVRLLEGKFYVDELYDTLIVEPFNWLSDQLYSWIERNVVDALVEGVGSFIIALSRLLRYLQSGSVSFYLLFMVLGIILVLVFNLFL